LRKQSLHLASKMRFLAAQFEALLRDELWRQLAAHANGMAARLADAVRELPGIEVTHPVQANAVFATLPRGAIDQLRQRFPFYVWDESRGEVRWMCSWDTKEEDVDQLVNAARAALTS
jgi:threonine aldolase